MVFRMMIEFPAWLNIFSTSRDQTYHLGKSLGQKVQPADLICLSGDLGAGKTTLVAGIVAGWGSESRVTSPTYTLVHIYQRALDHTRFYHLDAYRLETPAAASGIGLDDILSDNAPVVIEWAEQVQPFLPAECLWIDLHLEEASPNQRRLELRAQGQRYTMLLNELRLLWYEGVAHRATGD